MAKPCGPLKYRETPDRSSPGPGADPGRATATEAVIPTTNAQMPASKASLVHMRYKPFPAMCAPPSWTPVVGGRQ
ncbi:hypothetical protein GCM10010518_20310 [Kitasatospora cinereorecta]